MTGNEQPPTGPPPNYGGQQPQAGQPQQPQAPQPPTWQPRPRKPALSAALKRAAMKAGMIGFGVMSLGWALLSFSVGIGLFAGFFAFILGIIGKTSESEQDDFQEMMRFFEQLNLSAWIIPLIVIGLIGAALWVWSVFLSSGVLRRAGHPSPWGVTWAGAGIAIVASWVISWIAWIPLNFIPFAGDSLEGAIGLAIVLAIVSLLIDVAIAVVLGWLAWWWMSHAMRPAVASDPA